MGTFHSALTELAGGELLEPASSLEASSLNLAFIVGPSYLTLGISALAWPLVHSLALAVALVGLTGSLEGPAFSGTIAIRQRETPPAVRVQVLTTMSSLGLVASSLGAAIGGALHSPDASILAFLVVKALAALAVLSGAATSRPRPAPEPPPPER